MQRRMVMAGGTALAAIGPKGAAVAQSGLIVPAEEAPHQRTFMQWPVNRKVHPDGDFLDYAQATIADIANAIAAFEPVTMLMAAGDIDRARRLLSGAVEIWDIPTEDLWCRDAGPLFARRPDGGLVVSHIQFNGWGGKQVHARDARIATAVARQLELPLVDTGLRGEAGGVEQDAPDYCWRVDDPFNVAALNIHDALVAAGLKVEVIPEPNRRRVKSIDFVASYANYYV